MKSRLPWAVGVLLMGAVALTTGCDDDDQPAVMMDAATDTGGTGGTGGTTGTDAGTDRPATDTPVTMDMPAADVPVGGGDTGGTPDTAVPTTLKVTLGPAGGEITFHGGRLTIVVPRGALIRPTDIELSVVGTAPAGGLGTVYSIEPAHEPLARAAIVKIKYSAAEIGTAHATELRIGRFAEAHWSDLAGTKVNVAGASQTVQADLPRFGVFGLVAGVCALCDKTEACQLNAPCMTAEMMAGKCIAFGNMCTKCVPTCDADGDGYCTNSVRSDPNDADINVGPDAPEICGNNTDDNSDNHIDEGCKVCKGDGDCTVGNEYCSGGVCNVCAGGCEPAGCRFGFMEPSAEMPLGAEGVPGRCFDYGVGCSKCVPTCDADGDGYCPQKDPGNGQMGEDCNDANRDAFPGAAEICGNSIDDDCNGYVDDDCESCIGGGQCPRPGFACVLGSCEGCKATCTVGAACNLPGGGDPGSVGPEGVCEQYGNSCSRCVPKCDDDGDGFCPGNTGNALIPGNDCNDKDPDVYPGAPVEVCGNGEDDNCNDTEDEGCEACSKDDDCPNGLACVGGVCELCNAGCDVDNCRFGVTDTSTGVQGACFEYGRGQSCQKCVPTCDKDGDGYCPGATVSGQEGGDCLDSNGAVHPGALEVCGNSVDDDCDGLTDEACGACNTGLMCGVSESCTTQL